MRDQTSATTAPRAAAFEDDARSYRGTRNIVLVGPRRHYHTPHSGYETLGRFLNGATLAPAIASSVDRRTGTIASLMSEARRARLLRRLGLYWYGRRRLLEELRLVPTLMFSRGIVVHHLYAEESYRLGGYVPRLRGSVLVGTFHQPASVFPRYVADPVHLRHLDAIVALARPQSDFLRSYVDPGRVHFVPHGVDTEFFTPAADEPAEFRCLFVGYWLRDLETLKAVVGRLAPEGVGFDLITSRRLPELRSLPGVTVRTGVDEEAFRNAYRRASAFVLPLRDATANNALLEAMACGLPIVATGIGGTFDYCDDSNAMLLPPGDVEGWLEAIRRLRRDGDLRRRMGRRSRERTVGEFDWTHVARSMRAVYEEALDQRR